MLALRGVRFLGIKVAMNMYYCRDPDERPEYQPFSYGPPRYSH
jgi:hypothetical protein